tara:strand:+ start:59975 stop:60199 length:225 start_codon:yes stop_codon:yes gene_type:complete
MFTLRVINNEITKELYADTKHYNGGYDMIQDHAFSHLFPNGKCLWVYRELVFEMAEAHGWEVEVRTVRKDSNTI